MRESYICPFTSWVGRHWVEKNLLSEMMLDDLKNGW